jgi:hypothetical protein
VLDWYLLGKKAAGPSQEAPPREGEDQSD